MIWYDAQTHEPVAPGACEDGGFPSIDDYPCPYCSVNRGLNGTQVRINHIWVAVCLCEHCGNILLTTV